MDSLAQYRLNNAADKLESAKLLLCQTADYLRRKYLLQSAVNGVKAFYIGGAPQIIAGLFQFSYGWIEIRPRTDRDLEH